MLWRWRGAQYRGRSRLGRRGSGGRTRHHGDQADASSSPASARRYPRVAENYTEALEFALSGKIVVMGGITPAQTTDAVSAVLAESVGADLLINATSIDGIYSADPKKDASAVRHEHLTPRELLEILTANRMNAGANTVLDIVAGKVIERSGIPLLVIDGREPDNLYRAIAEGAFVGTIVSKEGAEPRPT